MVEQRAGVPIQSHDLLGLTANPAEQEVLQQRLTCGLVGWRGNPQTRYILTLDRDITYSCDDGLSRSYGREAVQ